MTTQLPDLSKGIRGKSSIYVATNIREKSSNRGFTLVELLVGMVITSIFLVFAGSGLISILQNHRQTEAEVDQHIQLNRAADFIADDIREAKAASTTAPSGWIVPANYSAILYLTKPDDSTVAYYTFDTSSGSNWQGPQMIYRATASNSLGNPLVDRVSSASPGCSGSGTSGFEVSPSPLTPSNRSIRLCLLGDLPNGTTKLVQNTVTLRSNEVSSTP
ncbi:prepilin-type N-terminal cleavage/methylation domain-containing protein [Acaryochloris sp. IP29b_bin.137]|uniref:prepilin-type N-terminal cleavage/methylation domain-containing protein n=1 Tax=Acaryochloris sp. IP29b_bin.137 TaxID=2969217 RepID=UPI00261B9AB0|nr:prepilin-type N-terminal cleavage/methylation domain-containing protein [Acaryochloris sp. IP29b_bin.137]